MQPQIEQINIRIDAATKAAAEKVFNQLGLSATDAIRMFYRQVSMRQGLPFEARVTNPAAQKKNKITTAMIKKSVQRNIETLKNLADR